MPLLAKLDLERAIAATQDNATIRDTVRPRSVREAAVHSAKNTRQVFFDVSRLVLESGAGETLCFGRSRCGYDTWRTTEQNRKAVGIGGISG